MSTLDDLNYQSILDMSNDEAIEHLRQVRLSRRTPVKKAKASSGSKKKVTAKQTPNLTPEQAKKLLQLMEDSND